MLIQLDENGIVKEQNINVEDKVLMIYGFNNSGKTSFLKAIDSFCNQELFRSVLNQTETISSIYIPANRLTIRDVYTRREKIKDKEDFLNYKREMYKEYDLHLKIIRDDLLQNEIIKSYLCEKIKLIFGQDDFSFEKRSSDGIENIINIYLNIIWSITYLDNICEYSDIQFEERLKNGQVLVLLDEAELFLHASVQNRFISDIHADFPNCKFIMTTHSPLLLSRHKEMQVYKIEKGSLAGIEDKVYYMDLDDIFEGYFEVSKFPNDVAQSLNYLGNVWLTKKISDSSKVKREMEYIRRDYPNIYEEYRDLFAKVEKMI